MADDSNIDAPPGAYAKDTVSANGEHDDDVEVLYTHRKPKRVDVVEKNGTKIRYEIREMEDDDFASWLKESGRRFQFVDGKPVKQRFEGMHASLIARCLYDLQGRRVPKAMIETWGVALKQKLANYCTEVNGLSRTAEDEEGKG